MNSRLKFRAWLDQERKMVYQGADETTESFMRKYANCYLMEFTGLKVITTRGYAREIYENDIVRELDSSGLVTNSPLIDVVWENTDDYNGWSIMTGIKYECLGNLYENPDLILTLYRNANREVCSLANDMNIALQRILNLDEQLDKNPDLVDTYMRSSQESGDLDAHLEKALLLNNDLLSKTLGLTNTPKIKYNFDTGITENYKPDTLQENIDEWAEKEECCACNCWRNSTTCCDCCARDAEAEVDFGDSNDILDAMVADPNWECHKNKLCCGNGSEAEEDPNNILARLGDTNKDALIQLMRNISSLREQNSILREEVEAIRKQYPDSQIIANCEA